MAGEESLVRALGARGMQAVATYRMAPKEELRSAETARPWFEKANVEAVVAVRPVSAETEQTYSPSVWVSPNYGTLWGYYGYGWTAVYEIGPTPVETVVVVENLIFSVPLNKLLWAGVTETTNPKNAAAAIKDIVTESVKKMTEEGLIRRK